MDELERYSVIDSHMKREFLLLQGTGCIWKKCTFCDYHNDISKNPYEVNKAVIDKISGKYSVIDIINSGSIFELDIKTLEYLKDKITEKNIKTLWCESHWLYHKRLDEIRNYFKGVNVKFRIGAETFDQIMRKKWNKGIPENITAKKISNFFDGACLLVCVQGQTKESILKDIELAKNNFEYFNVNVFGENSTDVKADKELKKWFTEEIAPQLEKYNNIEVLIDNTDLGVG
ncbi:MAG: radical SAM protein [Ruminococcaceae bacterium]|nr:radical SAM protein [Oscillospiraceae bacterium]